MNKITLGLLALFASASVQAGQPNPAGIFDQYNCEYGSLIKEEYDDGFKKVPREKHYFTMSVRGGAALQYTTFDNRTALMVLWPEIENSIVVGIHLKHTLLEGNYFREFPHMPKYFEGGGAPLSDFGAWGGKGYFIDCYVE